MKKSAAIFTAGVCVGIGAALAFMALRSGNVVSALDGKALRPAAALLGKEQVDQAPSSATELASEIERLHRWADGTEPGLLASEVTEYLESWSEVDPDAALAFVLKAPRFPNRNAAISVPLAVITRRDPAAAVAWLLKNITLESQRSSIAESVVERAGNVAPAQVLEFALADGFFVSRHAFSGPLESLVKTQPQQALAYLARLSPEGQDIVRGGFVESWAEADPEAALAWATAQQGRGGSPLIFSLVEGCARSGRMQLPALLARLAVPPDDLENVSRAWLRGSRGGFDEQTVSSLPAGPVRIDYVRSMAIDTFAESPDRIVAFVRSNLPPEEQQDALYLGWEQWFSSDPIAATRWAEKSGDSALGSAFLERARWRELLRDPQAALRSLHMVSDSAERARVSEEVLERLSYEDPAAAAAWLAQNRREGASPRFVGQLSERYLSADEGAAMEWIAKLPAGKGKDAALLSAAEHWASQNDPHFASEAVGAIADPSVRQAAVTRVFGQMYERDRATAERWLEAQPLTPATRETIKALISTFFDR